MSDVIEGAQAAPEPVNQAEAMVAQAAEAGGAAAPQETPATPEPSAAGSDRPRSQERRSNRQPRPEGERVVRTLAVGQEVKGKVKRLSEFGAFVDIGVGRDGLVHISELSVKRIAKVTDVINEGEEHTFWIKNLDRERNRISLTMIAPGTTTMRDLNKDDLVTGTVTRMVPYGAFVDIGVGRDALLHVREMSNRFVAKPEDIVKVGEQIEARIIEIQKRRGRIDLSIKGLREEPEPEPQPEAADQQGARAAAEPEPEVADTMADLEVLSPMELAFRKAMKQNPDAEQAGSRKETKEEYRRRIRLEQEEAFQRTLRQK